MTERAAFDSEPIRTPLTGDDGIDLSIIELLFYAYRIPTRSSPIMDSDGRTTGCCISSTESRD